MSPLPAQEDMHQQLLPLPLKEEATENAGAKLQTHGTRNEWSVGREEFFVVPSLSLSVSGLSSLGPQNWERVKTRTTSESESAIVSECDRGMEWQSLSWTRDGNAGKKRERERDRGSLVLLVTDGAPDRDEDYDCDCVHDWEETTSGKKR